MTTSLICFIHFRSISLPRPVRLSYCD